MEASRTEGKTGAMITRNGKGPEDTDPSQVPSLDGTRGMTAAI